MLSDSAIRQCNQTVGCDGTPVIGHLKQPVMHKVHLAKSTNHRTYYDDKKQTEGILYFRGFSTGDIFSNR